MIKKKVTFREFTDLAEAKCKVDMFVEFNHDFTSATITERQHKRLDMFIHDPVFDSETTKKYPKCQTLLTKMNNGVTFTDRI